MSKRTLIPLLLAALLGGVTGCGNYTVAFEQESIINTSKRDDASKSQQLEVDIVCLDKDEARRVPDLARGGVNSKEWFAKRGNAAPCNGLPADRVYSLSNDSGWKRYSTPLGGALLPTNRYEDGKSSHSFTFKFPEFLEGDSVVLIYGKFLSDQGVRELPPVRLSPAPRGDKIRIRVGQEDMLLIEE